jgi:hypothetical protein
MILVLINNPYSDSHLPLHTISNVIFTTKYFVLVHSSYGLIHCVLITVGLSFYVLTLYGYDLISFVRLFYYRCYAC